LQQCGLKFKEINMNAVKITSAPTKTELLIPANEIDLAVPEISIVVPALNEQITIGEFVDWCWQGLRDAGVNGEIIIVDSSSDDTPNIALAKGARVLRTPKRGLGQAYLDAIPFIRGQFIIMGDCDLTYDFREIKPFVDEFHNGAEYVMGSRFRGSIEDAAMPPLHRYFGTPLTTWILNRIYSSSYSDIHCGMRGLTRDALEKINLTSTGWEYASEMVLKATRKGLKISEVPVKFYKDRDGRMSHHRRAGFWSPWHAGWINLRVMLIYTPDSFVLKPGIVVAFLSLVFAMASWFGNFGIGNVKLGTITLVASLSALVFSLNMMQIGLMARKLHGMRLGRLNSLISIYQYDYGMTLSMLMFIAGIGISTLSVYGFVENNFAFLPNAKNMVVGIFLIIFASQHFGFTLLNGLFDRILKKGKQDE
jgi:glycosyltransferase involved in cell wall biosynthesis